MTEREALSLRPFTCLRAGMRLARQAYPRILGVYLLGAFLSSRVPFGIIRGPVMCGLYDCILDEYDGGRAALATLFRGFRRFAQGFVAVALASIPLIVFLLACPAYLTGRLVVFNFWGAPELLFRPGGAFSPREDLWTLLVMAAAGVLVLFLARVFFLFVFPLVSDGRLTGIEAAKTSIRQAWLHFFPLAGLVLAMSVLELAGAACLVVGYFFIRPFTLSVTAAAYRRLNPITGRPGGSSV